MVKCQICHQNFYVKPSLKKRGWGKFCSVQCRSQATKKGEVVERNTCHLKIYRSLNKISRSKSHKFFCSKSCQSLWRNREYVESKSKNWKDGRKSYRNILIRHHIKPVCEICGIKDLRVLNVHHRDHNRFHNQLDNLIWLCLNCHYLTHLNDKIK